MSAELYQLKIPFKLNFSHAKADRFFSDSIILKISSETATGEVVSGFGEAVVREYVSGSINGSTDSRLEAVKTTVNNLLAPFRENPIGKEEILETLANMNPPVEELPLLCAVESALLQLLCKIESTDIYGLLGRSPVRKELYYGGTLPLLPEKAAENLLNGYKKLGIGNIRVKVGADPEYNRRTLELVRLVMGKSYDIKVDANAGWSLDDAEKNIPLLEEFGINLVEEPFGREAPDENSLIKKLTESGRAENITFMADESALTADDIKNAADNKTYGMANIRLAKNGGLLKALEMAETAEKYGIRYMSGCHVGETGILSAAGRVAASLMKKPEYIDGSYDSHLLSGNITGEDLSFGYKGKAEIIQNKGLGYTVDEKKLKGYSSEQIRCF